MANPPINPQRSDPIRDRFFKPLEIADLVSNCLFVLTAVLSFLALNYDPKAEQDAYNLIQTAFITSAVLLFILGQVSRLYFWPRAETPRRKDFLSYCLSTNLTHIRTTGYYNNDEANPIRRMGAAVLENTLFTRAVNLKMLKGVRFWTALYFVVWFVAIEMRNTDLGWIAVAAQVLFSEQLVSRWLRLEWLGRKCEEIHNNLLVIFVSGAAPDAMQPFVLDAFVGYETAKANAGVLTSEKIFHKLNPSLSAEWEQIKQSAKIS